MLAAKPSPGPPWLPVAPFADRATLVAGDGGFQSDFDFVAALVLVDRSFAVVSSTAWTRDGAYGACIGRDAIAVPNTAEWFAVAVELIEGALPAPAVGFAPWQMLRVRWDLHL